MSVTDFSDPDQVIHIAARDLTGTREAKLAELDILLAQLQVVRLALCGQAVHIEGVADDRGERSQRRFTPSFNPSSRLRTLFTAFAPGPPPRKDPRS